MKHHCPPIICPSLLSCDLARLADEARNMLDLGAHWLHMDIMDNHFVPNLTFGAPVIKALRAAVPDDTFIDCHLMVTDPSSLVEPLQKAGASGMTFHIESNMPEGGVEALIQKIRDANMQVGIVIKPTTPVEDVFPYVHLVDLVLIMTVEPGFSGQSFMSDMMPKVKALRDKFPDLNIQVDGGLSPDTIDAAAEAGANVIVAASAIFSSKDRGKVIRQLRDSVEKHYEPNGKRQKK